MKSRYTIALGLFALAGVCGALYGQSQQTAYVLSDIEKITTLSAEQVEWMDYKRRNVPSVGHLGVSPGVNKRALEYQKLFAAGGAQAVADALMKVYPGPASGEDMSAAALAIHCRSNYAYSGRTTLDKKLAADKSRKPQLKTDQFVQDVLAITDALAARGGPLADNAAVEWLLNVSAEGLTSQHATSGNGNRKIPEIPEAITARAAEYLGHADPFVHAQAEWAVCIKVINDNDSKNRDNPWPGDNPPAWYDKWAAIPAEQYLDLDYMRQAISLHMHRRGEDLLTLAGDVARRAEGKAGWSRETGMSAEKLAQLDQAVETMRSGLTQLAGQIAAAGDDIATARKAWLTWRPTARVVAMTGPDVDFESITYFKRYSGGAHLQPGIHDAKFPLGGDIYVQQGLTPTSPTRALLGDALGEGVMMDMDLWYDADKIVFSHADNRRVMHLYEIHLDGSGLTQLTDGPYNDCDPAYLPDGTIAFGSMEAQAGTMCAKALGNVGPGGASHTNIYRLYRDGTRRRLSYCKDDDCYPGVLHDGRITWMRWDYQERGVDEIFSLWVIRPDGTSADGFYRVHIPDNLIIQSLRDPRAIPGSDKILATGGTHRTANEGLLIVADPSMGINNPDGIRTVTPCASPVSRGCGERMRAVEEGGVPYIGGYVTKPWALSPKSFLTSMGFDMPQSSNFHVYYVDNWGNKELIHRDRLFEAINVMPVRPRKKPPILPDLTDQTKTYATCYVDNVYADLPGVKPGEIKALRICQQMFWLTRVGEPGLQYHPLANASECFGYPGTGGPVRVVGTVPVHEDGSAYFQVPAKVDLYFQALDANHMAVQRMRTHVEFAPGENRGCIGCHETRETVINNVAMLGQAVKTPAVRPTPPSWGDTTLINYETMIQPIFNAKCVKCHGQSEPKGGVILTDQRDKYGFMQGYRAMFGLKPSDPTSGVVWNADGEVKRERYRGERHPWYDVMFDYVIVRKSLREDTSIPNPPKKYGAIAHPAARFLAGNDKHRQRLTDAEFQLLITWLDLQAPYFDTYMQSVRRGRQNALQRVKVEPFPPFGESRDHTVHRPEDKTARK